jgi:hypothetical protein
MKLVFMVREAVSKSTLCSRGAPPALCKEFERFGVLPTNSALRDR